MTSTLTSKGQITVPVEVRNRLKLHPGDRLEFLFTDDDRLEVVPLSGSVKDLKGMVPRPAQRVTLEDMEKAIGRGGEP